MGRAAGFHRPRGCREDQGRTRSSAPPVEESGFGAPASSRAWTDRRYRRTISCSADVSRAFGVISIIVRRHFSGA